MTACTQTSWTKKGLRGSLTVTKRSIYSAGGEWPQRRKPRQCIALCHNSPDKTNTYSWFVKYGRASSQTYLPPGSARFHSGLGLALPLCFSIRSPISPQLLRLAGSIA